MPRQISIEDSYTRLDTLDAVTKELRLLATSLLKRMHTDLLEEDDAATGKDINSGAGVHALRWLAHPKSIRLSTRPRPPQNPDGSRNRSFARMSKSAPCPNFLFSTRDGVDVVVDRLVNETLLPLFRKLHPEKSGWNLSLVNVAVTNMASAASETGGIGRDIGRMFRLQDEVLKQWRVETDVQTGGDEEIVPKHAESRVGSEDAPTPSQEETVGTSDRWESDDADMLDEGDSYQCAQCNAMMPTFAIGSHVRWHLHSSR